jgi:hypothetical protein
LKSASARRASATLAAVTAAALIGLAGAGPAQATTCSAGTYYKETGYTGYCAANPPGDFGPLWSGPGWAIFSPQHPPVYAPAPPGYVPPKAPKPVPASTRVGSTLKADKSGWAKGTVLKYRWLRNGVPISGATSATYKVRTADKGKKVTVRVTGTKAGRTTSKVGRTYNVR